MPPEKKSFINVDELMPQVSLEQVASYYGAPLPELHRLGSETRAKCFLSCGRTQETGDRVLAIQEGHPVKQWHCHQYGCGKSGNLVSLCDLMKPGTPAGGKPRGERFKEIAKDLQAIAGGVARPGAEPDETRPAAREGESAAGPVRERTGAGPRAAGRQVCRRWRVGYLPRDTGEDKTGGTMRGKIVYAYQSETGEVLTWFGRDPDFEDKHKAWAGSDKSEREPEKFHFVKGFHRGIELFGQHRLHMPEAKPILEALGIVVVEGPNDVIRLDTLGVPAVAVCSNTITREQAAKVAMLARNLSRGIVTIFLDCDPEGESGMKQALGYLAQVTAVRLAWTSRMYGGKFKNRQPESLLIQEWQEIEAYLRTGQAQGWSLG